MNQEFQIQESPACVKFSRIMRELHASVKKLFTKNGALRRRWNPSFSLFPESAG